MLIRDNHGKKKKEVVGGTQGGLDNMVKLSEEAQKQK